MTMKLWTRRFLLTVFIFCFSAAPALCRMDSTKLLRRDLADFFSDSRFFETQWGVAIVSLDHKEVLFAKNSQKLYIPASNDKIITAATALLRLGPDYRFKTRIFADGPIVNGVLKGNLIIAGFGDPSSSYRTGSKDPFIAFRDWAAKLKFHGIQAIEGKIIGDGAAFEETAYGQGWSWDDLIEGYAAPISALQFNENTITLEISPGQEPGSSAVIVTKPLANYPSIDSQVRSRSSEGSASIEVGQDRSSEILRIRGVVSMKNPPVLRSIAAQFPMRYYITALKQVLTEEGIVTTHCKTEESREPLPQSATLLWIHESLPLSELLPSIVKLSLNLACETLLRTVGMELRGEGSYTKGKEVVEETLSDIGIAPDSYAYADASGLSRLNLVTADMMIRILTYMYPHKYFNHFYDALSIAGVDGTLKNRMTKTRAENNVHAKTGTLSHISAISGYVRTKDGEMLAFSLIANNFIGSKESAEKLQDRVLTRLADFSRKTVKRKSITDRPNNKAKERK
jgi:serine-type D-Ala-D-Ala carboxypeptidase/endopeptidase (penicillin-binding protein 4)